MSESFFNLTWLIPLPTALAFFAIILFANPKKRLSSNIAVGAVILAWILSWLVAITFFVHPELTEHPFDLHVPWMPVGAATFHMGVAVDAVTAGMLFMVGFVLTMIFIYSTGYMTFPGHLDPSLNTDGLDPRYSRFFAYISLFAAGMLGLVVADNLLMLFIFWEVMGLCSYLLIGFWFEKKYPDPKQITPKGAGLKAFLTTRVGDVLFMMGLIFLFIHALNAGVSNPLNFQAIFENQEFLHELSTATVALPIFGSVSWAGLIAMLIFWGAIGKSAQFPLHVWLPDAMEGPTPVSALIHAATMVSAGVYLIVRMSPLFAAAAHAGSGVMVFVAFIGAFTALFAATIAVAQKDIKKVLAYSTISQLGYMIAALGIGAWVAAVIHLLIHAFFKALLFMGSGSVIHGVHHGHEHAHAHGHGHGHGHDAHEEYFDPQDMFNMGGLLKRMPITGWTFIIGGASLSAVPLITAGFWSKDEILAHAWDGGHMVVFWTLALGAFLTAFYTFRQIFLTFFGSPRTEAAEHTPENVRSMTWPLVALAFFALFGGFVAVPPDFPLVGPLASDFLAKLMEMQGEFYHLHVEAAAFNWVPALISMTLALGGIIIAWLVYGVKPLAAGQPDPLRKPLGPIYTLLENKYYFDELYAFLFIRPALRLADFTAKFDRQVIDRIVNWVGATGAWLARVLRRWVDEKFIDAVVNFAGLITQGTGEVVRLVQTGQAQNYLLVLLLSVVVLLLLVPIR